MFLRRLWLIVALALALLTIETPGGLPAGRLSAAAEEERVEPSAGRVPATPRGLDLSGRRLPSTNYAVPRAAIFMAPTGSDANPGTRARPVRSLKRAIALAPNNGTIVLRGGQYRDWHGDRRGFKFVAKSLTFQAYPREAPWLNGANAIRTSRWRKVPGRSLWYTPWSTPQFCAGEYYSRPLSSQSRNPNNGPCSHHDMASASSRHLSNDPQMVFVNGRPLRQQKSLASLGTSSFHYVWTRRRISIATSPVGKRIEIARRPVALVLAKGHRYRIRGVGFHQYASNQYHNLTAAALWAGGLVIVENSLFARNAAAGLALSKPQPGSLVRRSVFADNGYTALGANGNAPGNARNDLVVDGNIFVRNNAESFGDRCWVSCGQAGAKFAHMIGLRLSRNLVANTRGKSAGLWCDLDCRDVRYVYNTVRNNGGSGIFHEVSDTGIIAGNLLVANGYGMRVASANTKVYHNTLVDNVQGIKVYDDPRSRNRGGWRDVGPDTRNVDVANNVVAGRNYSVMGEASQENSGPPNTDADQLFGRLDYNTLHQSNGAHPAFVYWRDRRQRETLFRSRGAFVSAKRYERHSHWLTGSRDLLFVDRARGDYRVRRTSPAYRTARDLPRDVAAALGVRTHDPYRSRGGL